MTDRCICGRPVPCRLCLPLDPTGERTRSAPADAESWRLREAMQVERTDSAARKRAGRGGNRRKRRVTLRPAYAAAVFWIAHNDESGSGQTAAEVAEMVSTLLVADLFGAEPEDVAADVIRERRKAGLPGGEDSE